jgi:hypothetical protein
MQSFSGYVACLLQRDEGLMGVCSLPAYKQAPTASWLKSSSLATLTFGLAGDSAIMQVLSNCRAE